LLNLLIKLKFFLKLFHSIQHFLKPKIVKKYRKNLYFHLEKFYKFFIKFKFFKIFNLKKSNDFIKHKIFYNRIVYFQKKIYFERNPYYLHSFLKIKK
jgi:hypothetical protein